MSSLVLRGPRRAFGQTPPEALCAVHPQRAQFNARTFGRGPPLAAEVHPRQRYLVAASRVLLAASVFGLALLHLLEPSYDSRTRTLSEYALSPSGWVFTLSMLSMALGSALVLGVVWSGWRRRRWLLLLWVAGLVVVAAVPTDPSGATTVAGTVHATAAALAILALLIAEGATALTARSNRVFAGACALVVVAGLILASLYGGGAGERVAVGAHIVWLLSIGGYRWVATPAPIRMMD